LKADGSLHNENQPLQLNAGSANRSDAFSW